MHPTIDAPMNIFRPLYCYRGSILYIVQDYYDFLIILFTLFRIELDRMNAKVQFYAGFEIKRHSMSGKTFQ